MPDKEELEERINKMIDDERDFIIDAKSDPFYNDIKEERCYEERI